MKKIFTIIATCSIAGCSALDYRGDCYFAEQPSQYLVNNSGKYIDENGLLVSQPVLNPYYAQYQKCYPNQKAENTEIKDSTVKALLQDSYQINNKTYRLAEPRTSMRNDAYINSLYKAADGQTYLRHEVFYYPNNRAEFPTRFLNDINSNEGKFEAKTSNGQSYIIGKNNHNGYAIYVVKSVLDQRISIAQYIAKNPINQQEIAIIVKDLSQV